MKLHYVLALFSCVTLSGAWHCKTAFVQSKTDMVWDDNDLKTAQAVCGAENVEQKYETIREQSERQEKSKRMLNQSKNTHYTLTLGEGIPEGQVERHLKPSVVTGAAAPLNTGIR